MAELPAEVVDRAERLTRRARETRDDETDRRARAERDSLLAERGYEARIREDDDSVVLVCYPEEWLEDGTAALDHIEDTDRAIERRLSGPTDADWEAVIAYNERIVTAVAEEYGEDHAANARALAEYAANHHATTVDRLTDEQLTHFRDEYYPRNVWPDEEQSAVLAESIVAVEKAVESVSDTPPV